MLADSRGGLAGDRLISGAPQSRGAAAATSHRVWGGPALRTGRHLQETLDASRGSSWEVGYGTGGEALPATAASFHPSVRPGQPNLPSFWFGITEQN